MTVNFYSIIHHLNGGVGHELPYQLSLQAIVKSLGWNFIPLTSVDHNCENIPIDWFKNRIDHGIIEMPRSDVGKCFKSIYIYRFLTHTLSLAIKFRKFFKGKFDCSVNSVVFFESFNPLQLLALLASLSTVRLDNLNLVLLLRGSKNWGGPDHFLMAYSFAYSFKYLLAIFRLISRKVNIVITTDSELVKQSLIPFYNCDVIVYPIPHTDATHQDCKIESNNVTNLKVWWPGTPRRDKGSVHINKIIASISDSSNFYLYYSKSSLIDIVDNNRVVVLPPRINANEYNEIMNDADIILLPYDKYIYNESTSGIFTESIFASKITIVTEGTWMASELVRFNLDELVVNWDNFNINDYLQNMDMESLRSKVSRMSCSYKRYHNLSSFAQILERSIFH